MANRLQSFIQRVVGYEKPRAKQIEEPRADLIPFDNIQFNQFGTDLARAEQLKRYKGWVYAAVTKIAHEVANIELKLMKQNSDGDVEEVDNHPALDLLDAVNPFMTYYDLAETTLTFEELTGNAFWWLIRDGQGNIVEIYPWLRPDRVTVIPSKENFISGYKYQIPGSSESVTFAPDEIIHFKYMNPHDPYYGMGPVQAAAMPISVDEKSEAWNDQFYKNSARPDGILSFEDGLTDDQAKQIRMQWENMHGQGHEKRLGIISRGQYQPIGFSQKDMDFLKQREFSRDEILAIFKVPKTLLDPQDANYASAMVAKQVFVEEVIVPKMQKFVNMLNEFLLPHYGADDVFFDFTPPMKENEELKLKRYEVLSNVGAITVNEIREAEGLEAIEGGDDISEEETTAPTNLHASTPKHKAKTMVRRKSRSTTAELINTISKKLKENAKKKKAVVAPPPPKEKSAFEKIGEYTWNRKTKETEKDEERMRKILIPLFDAQEKRVNQSLVMKSAGLTFNLEAEEKLFVEAFLPFFTELVDKYGEDALRSLGITGFDLSSDVREHLLTTTGVFSKEINVTTEEKIRKALAAGVDAGESVPQIRRRITGVYEIAKTSRADAIVRTEVAKSTGYASQEAWEQSGVVKGKKWYTAQDDRVCSICQPLHGREWGLTKEIQTGDELFGDVLHEPAHVSCRCITLPITKKKGEVLRETKAVEEELKKTIEETKKRAAEVVSKTEQETEDAVRSIKETREKVEKALEDGSTQDSE